MKKLSILIPTIKRHENYLFNLMTELSKQIRPYEDEVEILVDDSETDLVGIKRNNLYSRANGIMAASIDSDDKISPNYIELQMNAVNSGCDCASLRGMYSVDGVDDGIFEHSIKYKEWRTTNNEVKYERYPTPLNAIKTSIAKQFKFPETSWAEDHVWSKQINESGLLKTEYYIDDIIYFYKKVTSK